jgi:hypothetical protein
MEKIKKMTDKGLKSSNLHLRYENTLNQLRKLQNFLKFIFLGQMQALDFGFHYFFQLHFS